MNSFPMEPLHMQGPFPLDDAAIDEEVTRTSPGNYALGYLDGGVFVVFYVGRADSDLRGRLHEWVGAPSPAPAHAASAQAAWGVQQRAGFPVGGPRLRAVETAEESSYTRFAFSYAASADDAFAEECRNYEDFGLCGALDNPGHPVASSVANRT